MSQETYRKKLRDPRWQKLRLQVMSVTGSRAASAVTRPPLSTSTTIFAGAGWTRGKYQLDELGTYCQPCHYEREVEMEHLQRAIFCLTKSAKREQIEALYKSLMYRGPVQQAVELVLKQVAA